MALPNIIHYCWFGRGTKSEQVIKCLNSWHQYAGDCEIVEWNEDNYDLNKNEYLKQAYQEKRWGFVSDYARLDIIYEYGGIYFDTDVELIRPIDELIAGTGFIGFEKANKAEQYYINTGGGFGAEKEDPLVLAMRDYYMHISFAQQ